MKDEELLKNYLPEKSVNQIMSWIIQNNVHLKITKNRSTKLGDYRPPIKHPNHRISINYNLNPFLFLITFVHELAHLIVWNTHQNTVAPHGSEWKAEYRELMNMILKTDVFPDDIYKVLTKSIINSKASSSSDIQLTRALKKYDIQPSGTHLEDLCENAVFVTENGRKFIKGAKRRTRYVCKNLENNKQYLFHPLTPVTGVNE